MNLLGKITKTPVLLALITCTFLASLTVLYVRESENAAQADYTITTARREAEQVTPQAPVLIDLNTATAQELQTLSGIGEVMAQRILDYRAEHGPFSTVDELLNVSGIGEATLAEFRDRVSVSVQPGHVSPSKKDSGADEAQAPGLIDLNTATAQELQTLHGIGEVLAQRIIDYRTEQGAFTCVQELLHVKGIGEVTLQKLLPYVTVSGQSEPQSPEEFTTAEENLT